MTPTRHASRVLAFLALAHIGCATTWTPEDSYPQTAQTELDLACNSPGSVFVNGELAGTTPLTTTLRYEQMVERSTRRVSYWSTQPGLALFITIVSWGLYLPFSFIPVDEQQSLSQLDDFRNAEFHLRVEAPGYRPWEEDLWLRGEDRLAISCKMERAD